MSKVTVYKCDICKVNYDDPLNVDSFVVMLSAGRQQSMEVCERCSTNKNIHELYTQAAIIVDNLHPRTDAKGNLPGKPITQPTNVHINKT